MKISIDSQKVEEALTRGVEKIYPSKEALGKVLKSGKKIRLYNGIDPTGKLHLGHLIVFRKLRQFQALGHEVIMLLGDFTGMIGDPTDKLAARKKLTREEVIANSEDYKKQASKFLNFSGKNPAKILYNSKWLNKLTFKDLIELASNFTVQQMLARDMFQQRLKEEKPIYLHEFLYPLAQAYDSVAMDVDMEVGGNDQTFNMLCGRDLMRVLKNKEKFVLALKLLTDPSGKKMGKTAGNMINLDEKPAEMFGKIMSWPDGMTAAGFELLTDLSLPEVGPREAKALLAKEVISACCDRQKAELAEEEFNRVFKEKELPSEIPEIAITEKTLDILDLLVKTKIARSKSEAKRLVLQKAVEIDGDLKEDWREAVAVKKGMVIKVGKRRFAKVE